MLNVNTEKVHKIKCVSVQSCSADGGRIVCLHAVNACQDGVDLVMNARTYSSFLLLGMYQIVWRRF